MHVHVDTKLFATAISERFPSDDVRARPIPLRIGSRVKVCQGDMDGSHSYYGRYVGCEGEIVRIPEITLNGEREELPVITLGVLLDGKYNERSQYGCYWFRPDELSVITEDEKENNKMLLLKGYKIAQVAVDGYGDHYVAHYEDDLEEGDKVVIAKNDDEYSCGVVTTVFVEAHMNCKPKFVIVCKIDDTAHCTRLDRARKALKLEQQLKSAVADYQQIALYEMLAEKSPEIAALLKELKEVTNV